MGEGGGGSGGGSGGGRGDGDAGNGWGDTGGGGGTDDGGGGNGDADGGGEDGDADGGGEDGKGGAAASFASAGLDDSNGGGGGGGGGCCSTAAGVRETRLVVGSAVELEDKVAAVAETGALATEDCSAAAGPLSICTARFPGSTAMYAATTKRPSESVAKIWAERTAKEERSSRRPRCLLRLRVLRRRGCSHSVSLPSLSLGLSSGISLRRGLPPLFLECLPASTSGIRCSDASQIFGGHCMRVQQLHVHQMYTSSQSGSRQAGAAIVSLLKNVMLGSR